MRRAGGAYMANCHVCGRLGYAAHVCAAAHRGIIRLHLATPSTYCCCLYGGFLMHTSQVPRCMRHPRCRKQWQDPNRCSYPASAGTSSRAWRNLQQQ